ncbi:hypothetical protein MPSEU_000955200 [Mayamaea pseudoterrestris]|nr:hypothetical protein MPSEU_000955200 [Mayamaea pseudoterrestris]
MNLEDSLAARALTLPCHRVLHHPEMSPRSKSVTREPSPWRNILLGVVIGLLIAATISDSNTEYTMNERLLETTNNALALRKERETAISSLSDTESDSGWHAINVYYGDRDHLQFYSSINKNYFDKVHWFSQRRQDYVVSKLLRNKRNGYFVDLAANDAVQISNTYALETFFDWNGLCIEPNPEYWAGLAYRKCQVAAAVVGKRRKQELQFRYTKKGPRGGIVGDEFQNKPAVASKTKDVDLPRYGATLEDIFHKFNVPSVIDYMSLDIEGAEDFVMETFPFDRYRFRVLTIERSTDKLASILERHGYTLLKVLLAKQEFLWIHKDVESELDLSALQIDTEQYNYRERVDKIGLETA